MTTMTGSDVLVYAGVRTDRFYVRMASVMVGVAFVGFVPTYWVPMARGTLAITPLVHAHALLFFGWVALFWTQTWLAAHGRLGRHRELGVVGVLLACAMCIAGGRDHHGRAGNGPADRRSDDTRPPNARPRASGLLGCRCGTPRLAGATHSVEHDAVLDALHGVDRPGCRSSDTRSRTVTVFTNCLPAGRRVGSGQGSRRCEGASRAELTASKPSPPWRHGRRV